jgi:branched-chain amino acid aminotransferase
MGKPTITLKQRTTPVELPDPLGFGAHFTDHLYEARYEEGKGWFNHTIKPLEPLALHPASSFMHYGQAIFEGLKAYRKGDDILLFRPDQNFERMNNSAARLCMPALDVAETVEHLKALVEIEKDWIPTNKGEALYIRPYMIGTEAALGVRPSKSYIFQIILSPVGAYYASGFAPVKILVEDEYVRAVRGGLGESKAAANYGGSMLAALKAKKKGFTQVLWLDAVERKYVEEVGTMNIFIRFNDEVATPALSGTILPGVTRRSVLKVLDDWKMNPVERKIPIDEVVERHAKGEVLEVFGAGTAAVISAVGELAYKDNRMTIGDGGVGELSQKLFDELTGVQYGEKPDPYGWVVKA